MKKIANIFFFIRRILFGIYKRFELNAQCPPFEGGRGMKAELLKQTYFLSTLKISHRNASTTINVDDQQSANMHVGDPSCVSMTKRAKAFAFVLMLFAFIAFTSSAQQITQTIRGKVNDKNSQTPLPGATIIITDITPLTGTTTDANGNFRIENITIGRHQIKVTFLGYNEIAMPVTLNSAKELILNIDLEESFIQKQEVVISADADKTRSGNEMSTVSARGFFIEEANRYAGSLNDPSRMASNYAGVVGANDSRNDIIIRGNSPTGLLWRLEGIDIPNPNHFSTAGSSGGPVSILNNNMLANSDFITGAFAAEYSNALSGVFDLKMRNGNNEKREFTGQIGMNGFELNAEGPVSKKRGSSYNLAYRYSALTLMQKMGIDYGSASIPYYQDFSMKLNFPTAKGNFSVFSIGGLSHAAVLAKNKKKTDLVGSDDFDVYSISNMGVSGAHYTHYLNKKTYAKIILAGCLSENSLQLDSLDINKDPSVFRKEQNFKMNYSLHSFVNNKISNRVNIKSGIFVERIDFNNNNIRHYGGTATKTIFEAKGNSYLTRIYSEASIKLTSKLTFNPGITYLYFLLNNTQALDPRAAMSYTLTPTQKISFGYGLHSRTQELPIYFVETKTGNEYVKTNENLNYSKAHHFVLGHDYSINEFVRLKTEVYYQQIFNAPVETRPSYFSMLNSGADFVIPYVDSLTNNGTGRNYGIELTLEKFYSKGYYYLATVSIFESKYKGSDGIERNTAFNSNYAANVLFGKEFKIKENHVLSIDLKSAFVGGKRYIPIDLEKSRLAGYEIRDYSNPYQKQYTPYCRPDIKISFRLNSKKISQEWAIISQNFIGYKNLFLQSYNVQTGNIDSVNQLRFFTVGYYKIYF